jgi:hypothetical protein
MTRVVHWAQNGSLNHYATAYNHQNFMPPSSEIAILHLRVLWGSDRPANLVQWASMVGSVLTVAGIAKLLGAGRKSHLLAATFAISVPMGILQATSTQNDLVTTFWLVSLAFLVVLSKQRTPQSFELLILGIVLGLGMLTKATFYIYAMPFVIWFVLSLRNQIGFKQWLAQMAGIFLIAVLVNLGYWSRNWETYGNVFGPATYFQRALATDFESGLEESANDLNAGLSEEPDAAIQGTLHQVGDYITTGVTRLPQMMTKNAVTPSASLNSIILEVATRLPLLFGEDFQEVQSLQAWNHEDTAGNPLHLFFVFLTLIALILFGLRRSLKFTIHYALACLAGYFLMAILLSNGSSLDGVRFQLPFFVLWAPVVGSVISAFGRPILSGLFAILFIIFALPWILFNNTRPVIGLPPWPTRTGSVFVVNERALMYNSIPKYREPYGELTKLLRQSECREVGLRLDSHDLEYVVWWELEAPQSGFELKAVDSVDRLRRYLDETFQPCVILCTTCGGRLELDGLSRSGEFGNIVLFTNLQSIQDWNE